MSVTFFVEGGSRNDVNVSNANAREILSALGYDARDIAGDDAADTFLGRVVLALGLAPTDPGRPAVQDGNVIDCGRAPGYLQTRLRELHTLAQSAVRSRQHIYWG